MVCAPEKNACPLRDSRKFELRARGLDGALERVRVRRLRSEVQELTRFPGSADVRVGLEFRALLEVRFKRRVQRNVDEISLVQRVFGCNHPEDQTPLFHHSSRIVSET